MAIICARIYYVVFNWSLYADAPSEIIKIWHGGLGMYGVLIGAILAMVIYTRYKKLSLLAFLDLVCMGFLIGQFLGRWGNFMNREAFGYETTVFCRMGLTLNGVTIYVHPTFLYESLWNFLGFILIHFFSKKHRRYDGQIFLMYLCWYGFGRMFIEGLRTDSLYLFNTGIRVSQLVAFLCFVICGALLIYNKVKVQHDPADMFVNKVAAANTPVIEFAGNDTENEDTEEATTEKTDASEEETDTDVAASDEEPDLSPDNDVSNESSTEEDSEDNIDTENINIEN
jgi:phosphatidylglycerol:prolipoprotein diacylglycerol transferase